MFRDITYHAYMWLTRAARSHAARKWIFGTTHSPDLRQIVLFFYTTCGAGKQRLLSKRQNATTGELIIKRERKKGRKNNNLNEIFILVLISFQPMFHDRYNKGRGMCYLACGVVNIKEHLLLIGKSSPCSGGSGFLSHYMIGSLPYVQRHIP